MSSFVVSDATTSALAQQAAISGLIDMTEIEQLGRRIKLDNLIATWHRYAGRHEPKPTMGDVHFKLQVAEGPLHPLVIKQLIECWDYQCMEYQGFDKTPTNELMHKLWELLDTDHPGSLEAPFIWDIHHINEALQSTIDAFQRNRQEV